MSGPADGVDWEEAERRERRRDLLAAPVVVGFFVGILLLTEGFGFWTGGEAWVVVGLLFALMGLALSVSQLSRGQRARTAATYRVQAALGAHADPGPELRQRADQQARHTARTARIAWLALLGPLSLLAVGDWATRPVAASAGAALVGGAAVLYGLWLRARLRQARRWLADPPGPPRETPPPSTAERWLTGRRAVALMGSVAVLGLAVGLVSAFSD